MTRTIMLFLTVILAMLPAGSHGAESLAEPRDSDTPFVFEGASPVPGEPTAPVDDARTPVAVPPQEREISTSSEQVRMQEPVVEAPPAPTASAAQGVRVVWAQRPLELTIGPGRETQIIFPDGIGWYDVKVPERIAGVLDVQTIDTRTYLRAHAVFDTARIHVQSRDGAAYYLFDVRSVDGAAVPVDVELVDPGLRSTNVEQAPTPSMGTDRVMALGATDEAPEIALTRFMATQFYGPARLSLVLEGARRVPLDLPASAAIRIARSSELRTRPLAAWRYGDVFGVAVRVVNTSKSDVVLDPRTFRGEWIAATAQHPLLVGQASQLAKSAAANETTLYLISRVPPSQALAAALQDGGAAWR